MRNVTIAGILITLICGSAQAQTGASYRPVQEVCLFSSFLPAAESPVALQALKAPVSDGHNFVPTFGARLAKQVSKLTPPEGGVLAVPGNLLREAYDFENADWGSVGDHASQRILRPARDWTNFEYQRMDDSAADSKMTFMVSSVPVLGLEENGYVAGFNLKF